MDRWMDTCIRWKEGKDRNWLNLWCYLAYHACKQKWYKRTVQQWLTLSEAGDWPLQKKMKLPYLVNLEKHSIMLCHVESMRMQRDYFKTSREFVSLWERVEGIVSTGSVLLPLSCLKGSREMSSKKVMQLKAHLKFLYPNVCIVGYKQELKSLVEKIIEIQAICYHGNVLGRITQLEDCNQEPQAVYKC